MSGNVGEIAQGNRRKITCRSRVSWLAVCTQTIPLQASWKS